MPKLTLDKILQSQGFGTRKWCRELVEDGEVTINGAIVRDFKTPIETTDLEFEIFDEPWKFREKIYIALNKPSNYECSRKPSHHPSILTLLPEQFTWRDVQPVGRLDHDTTGLLLMSDDGGFIHSLSSPKRHVPKLYRATTAETVSDQLITELKTGVKLIDEPIPLAATTCMKISSHEIELSIEQGKYHQVKRMLAAAGNHCAALERIAVGGLYLHDLNLELGQWMYLDSSHLEKLYAE